MTDYSDLAAKVEALAADLEDEATWDVSLPVAAVRTLLARRLRAILPQPLKIEPGKWYRTRDGRKVFVLGVTYDTRIETVFQEGGAWMLGRHRPDGSWLSLAIDPLDIIAPWEDSHD